ncbi:MAG TPA: hypothetical protein VGC46_06900 [Allosphingosinicella sp.]
MALMSIACLFGHHRPSLQSITRRQGGYAAICESCARPLERSAETRWQASDPLDGRPGSQSAA